MVPSVLLSEVRPFASMVPPWHSDCSDCNLLNLLGREDEGVSPEGHDQWWSGTLSLDARITCWYFLQNPRADFRFATVPCWFWCLSILWFRIEVFRVLLMFLSFEFFWLVDFQRYRILTACHGGPPLQFLRTGATDCIAPPNPVAIEWHQVHLQVREKVYSIYSVAPSKWSCKCNWTLIFFRLQNCNAIIGYYWLFAVNCQVPLSRQLLLKLRRQVPVELVKSQCQWTLYW